MSCVLKEIGALQKSYDKLLKKGMTKKDLCNLVIPFRNKHKLSDSDALRITRKEMPIYEIAEKLEGSQRIYTDMLVTFGSRAGYMSAVGAIELPAGIDGEAELARYAEQVIDEFQSQEDMSFDEFIETALLHQFRPGNELNRWRD